MSEGDMSELDWLQLWFLDQLYNEREHGFGIRIETLDNPGWRILIYLDGTAYENFYFKEIKNYSDEINWWNIRIEDKIFKGSCGARNLTEVIRVFRDWIDLNS